MFEQVNILVSFVFAIALTHLLSTGTNLFIARRRVRVSGLLALWMLNALISLIVNWLGLWGLHAMTRWSVLDVMLQFIPAIFQYFTCSLVSIDGGRRIDMRAFYNRQRRGFTGSFAAMLVVNLIQNYVYRDSTQGFGGNDWIWEDLLILPMLAAVLLAGWARPLWVQWSAAFIMCAFQAYFLITFTIPS